MAEEEKPPVTEEVREEPVVAEAAESQPKEDEEKEVAESKADDHSEVAASTAEVKPAVKKMKGKRSIVIEGIAHVNASFNNTIVTITNLRGDVLAWSSSGACGFKGSKKGTPYAGQLAAAAAAKVVTDPKSGCGMEKIRVYLNGFGASRDSVIRTLAASFKVTALVDTTSIPHNGCRRQKKPRA